MDDFLDQRHDDKYEVTSQKKVDMAGGLTKEYTDYEKSLVMPSDYVDDFISDMSKHVFDYGVLSHSEVVENYLAHHGTKGQKWGERKYQNSDGSLTPLGRVHYGVGAARKKASEVASKAGKAIKKKVNPSEEDLLEKLEKAQSKQNKRELKEAINEAKGKKKSLKDMSDAEQIDLYNRMKREQAIKEMKRENSPLNSIKNGAQTAAKGAAWTASMTAKAGGMILKPVASTAASMAGYAVKQAGKAAVDNLLVPKIQNSSQKLDQAKKDSDNMLKILENKKKTNDLNNPLAKVNETERLKQEILNNRLKSKETAKKLIDFNKPVEKTYKEKKDEAVDRFLATEAHYKTAALMGDAKTRARAAERLDALNKATKGKQ